jgi:hypothetical protein
MHHFPRLFCVVACLVCLCATPVLSADPPPGSQSPSAALTPASSLSLSAVNPPADKGNGIDPDG